ncbi:GGDEF domain-containing protein [Marinobacterium aestuariivivens]|uniref:GGDEF domain-containing protein n=1 Tax=Marinobacterium aestuariivivens TaxID=1698799 RepID=UPI0036D2E933
MIDIESVLRAAGVYEQELGPLAIRHVDTLGADQDQFWGDEGIFETEGVQTQVVSFRRNWWQLGVVPRARGALAAGLRVKALSYGLLLAMVALSLQLVRIFHRAEERATRDPLTALPNRRLLLERARQLVSLSNRSGLGFGLCYVDLNGFKPVNDKLGHHAGDAVLLEVAKRLLGALRQSDTVARTGGDEFVILLPLMQGADEARQVIRKLAQALEPPISYRGHQIDIGASFGCALYPTDAENLEALMAVADTRMYEMKAYSKQA